MMLRLDGAIAAVDRGRESKAPPQLFQSKQAWEIIVNVKGIKKASACVRVYVCASPARLILLPIRLTAPRLITRLSALYNLISRINLWLRAHLMPGITNLIWRCTGSFIPPSLCPPPPPAPFLSLSLSSQLASTCGAPTTVGMTWAVKASSGLQGITSSGKPMLPTTKKTHTKKGKKAKKNPHQTEAKADTK